MAEFPRRFLPPMTQLCAFEAAARLHSFTAAALELNLTQSAVSRQIRALEELLGADLFIRHRQTVRLSAAGEAYAHDVRAALRQVSAATLGFQANPHGGTLTLGILPTFGTRWLAPRLPGFLAAHPGITLNLSTRLAPFDFHAEQVDAAVHFGAPDWRGAHLDFLFTERVVPACGPALLRTHRVRKPQDLQQLPLLHLASRPDAWQRWFEAMGVPCERVPGMRVDQFAVAAQAAMAGVGVALLPEFLIQDELANGSLRIVIDRPMQGRECYYLAYPTHRVSHPPLIAFRAWMQEESRALREAGQAGGKPSPGGT